jgi:tetratricopeptide (TPR) repeat protein
LGDKTHQVHQTGENAMLSNVQEMAMETDRLTQRGIVAAQVGDDAEAEAFLRQALELDRKNVEAWLWLAGVVDDLQEKQDHFQRVLALDPYNERARLGLERLQDKLGATPEVQVTAEDVMRCTWHPNRETGLRCNRCGRPMCPKCAVRHPVGLRCKECIKETRSSIYNVGVRNYLLAGSVGLCLSTMAGLVMGAIGGFWYLAFFVGPAIGAGIADLMWRVVRKRGKGMGVLASVCMILGALVAWELAALSLAGDFLFFDVGILIYLLVGVGAAFARLR